MNWRRLQALVLTILISLAGVVSTSQPALAESAPATPQPPTNSTTPDLLLTTIAGSHLLDAAEIYNQTNEPINLKNWQLEFTVEDAGGGCPTQTVKIALPNGWILAKHYLTLERSTSLTPATGDTAVPFVVDESDLLSSCVAPQLTSLAIFSDNEAEQTVIIPANTLTADNLAQHRQRNNSPNSQREISGEFSSDYKLVDASNAAFYSDLLYIPPANNSGLQILEILPNARDCSPLETALTCGDYVKLYNPTSKPINLAAYRLRIGYNGQNSTLDNTFTWGEALDPGNDELILEPGKYFTLSTRNDGRSLSITDSGNYVWLEDAYGAKIYSPAIEYPSATSTTKVGQAWAFDGSSWRWTSSPQPLGANNFPSIDQTNKTSSASSSLKPCAANQYRNPATNRCRLIISASTLVPCKPTQTRNSDTNRCRSILASSSGLKSCKANQLRNPATNRCRSTAASNSLKPCKPGWQRNATTNRCRKSGSVLGATTTKVQDVKSPVNLNNPRWLLAIVAVLAAIAYGLYEWRQEFMLALHNFKKPAPHSKISLLLKRLRR